MKSEEKGQWYRFWKKSGPMQLLSEDYKYFSGEYNKKEEIDSFIKNWADKVGGSFNSNYNYGYEPIDNPPKNWLKNELKKTQDYVKYCEGKMEMIKKLLNK